MIVSHGSGVGAVGGGSEMSVCVCVCACVCVCVLWVFKCHQNFTGGVCRKDLAAASM